MHAFLVVSLLASMLTPTTTPVADPCGPPACRQAFAAHYAVGVMRRAALNNGLTPADCMVSSPWHKLGAWVHIQAGDKGRDCLNADRSADKDLKRHRKNRMVELDFESAKHLCGITRVAEKPWRECPVQVTDIAPPAPG